MFTWICPQCGHEVPPSSSECPACAERRNQAAAPPPPPPPPYAAPPQPKYAPPQPQYAPPQPQFAAQPPQTPQYQPPQPQYAPPQPQQVYTINDRKKGMPTWLVAVLTVLVIGGGLFLLYRFVNGRNGQKAPAAAIPQPAAPAVVNSTHPYAKVVEVVAIRMIEATDKKPMVRFVVVNHSPANLAGLQLRITFRSASAPEGAEPIAVVEANVGEVPAFAIKEMESSLATNLKPYELPDWQFVKPVVEIIAPK